jgi:hypothetical protein
MLVAPAAPAAEASGRGHREPRIDRGLRDLRGRRGIYLSQARGARHLGTLRLELLGKPVRVTEVDPGLVETEFSLVRLGDPERAKKVYEGMTPLTADDIAECIAFAVTRPWHVNIDEMVVRPIAQARANAVARNVGL